MLTSSDVRCVSISGSQSIVDVLSRSRTEGFGARVYDAPDGSLFARMFAEIERPMTGWSRVPLMSGVLAEQFGVPEERCIELGYPRNDHLIAGADPPDIMIDRALYDTFAGRRPIVGYFPTYHDRPASVPVDEDLLEFDEREENLADRFWGSNVGGGACAALGDFIEGQVRNDRGHLADDPQEELA